MTAFGRAAIWSLPSRLKASVAALPTSTVAVRLTLLLLTLYGPNVWNLRVPTTMLAALGLIAPGLAERRLFWGVLAALQAYFLLPHAYVVDNHKLLMLYWCVALALLIGRKVELGAAAANLIGLSFALATFWKLASPDFVDGSFIHLTLLYDGRFSALSQIVGGVSSDVLSSNATMMRAVRGGDLTFAYLRDSRLLDLLSLGVTYWTLITEGLIAAAFLLRDSVLGKVRNWILLQFLVFTYPVATVIGFGWLLAIMGFCQARRTEPAARAAYLVVFVVMQLFLLPWGDYLLGARESS